MEIKMKKLIQLFLTFLKIGAFTFGGGYAMIALLENEFIEKKKWIDREEFLNMVAVAESTPGPVAVNSATYLGYRVGGVAGAALSTLAVSIPSFVIIYLISLFFDKFLSLVKVLAMLIPLIIVVAISNLSTAVIIIGISVCMLFVASPKYLQFIIVAVAVVVFAVAFVMLAGYRSTRIEAWLHPETAGTDAVFQTMMGLYAIGSGGLFGKGLGESLQKLGNVPESQNDMIFTIICEELGLFGAICLILLFILLIWRMMVIANNARDLYGSLLVIGVMSHIAIQVILNIAVVTNSLPNTGVILPFISYGGTSIIFLMAEIGLVLSVSRGIRLENV